MSGPLARRPRRLLRRSLAAIGLLLVVGLVFVVWKILPTATGYAARTACSAVLVAGREPGPVAAEDLAKQWYTSFTVDRAAQRVTATVLGLAPRVAVYRPGLGCVLAIDADPAALQTEGFEPAQALFDPCVEQFVVFHPLGKELQTQPEFTAPRPVLVKLLVE